MSPDNRDDPIAAFVVTVRFRVPVASHTLSLDISRDNVVRTLRRHVLKVTRYGGPDDARTDHRCFVSLRHWPLPPRRSIYSSYNINFVLLSSPCHVRGRGLFLCRIRPPKPLRNRIGRKCTPALVLSIYRESSDFADFCTLLRSVSILHRSRTSPTVKFTPLIVFLLFTPNAFLIFRYSGIAFSFGAFLRC